MAAATREAREAERGTAQAREELEGVRAQLEQKEQSIVLMHQQALELQGELKAAQEKALLAEKAAAAEKVANQSSSSASKKAPAPKADAKAFVGRIDLDESPGAEPITVQLANALRANGVRMLEYASHHSCPSPLLFACTRAHTAAATECSSQPTHDPSSQTPLRVRVRVYACAPRASLLR